MESAETEQMPIIETKTTYAGFGKRFAAMIIDWVLIAFFCSSIYWEMQMALNWYLKKLSSNGSLGYSSINSYDKYEAMLMNYYFIFIIIVVWCYYAGMESSPMKATLGKKTVGLEVADEDGNRISFLKATGRHFGKILSSLILYIGYLAMLGSSRKQTWHDAMSGCIVKEK